MFFDRFSDFWEPQSQAKLGSFDFVREPLLKGPHIPNPALLITRRFFLFKAENRTALVVSSTYIVNSYLSQNTKKEKKNNLFIDLFIYNGEGGGGG